MQSSANISAIATAVARVDNCANKLIFEETSSAENIRLDFICDGTEDEDATASIEFLRLGEDILVANRFYWAE
ncbi:MAG: hypothetical protein JKX91_14025 [Rhizobiaceae bacterium]|nr:hypothetical protein [Rhizobiaceae bacterium]